MTPVGKILAFLYTIKVYKNGDGHGFVWRWWNPLTYLFMPLLFVFAVLVQGLPETLKDKHYVGIGMNPWFIEHPERLEWL